MSGAYVDRMEVVLGINLGTKNLTTGFVQKRCLGPPAFQECGPGVPATGRPCFRNTDGTVVERVPHMRREPELARMGNPVTIHQNYIRLHRKPRESFEDEGGFPPSKHSGLVGSRHRELYALFRDLGPIGRAQDNGDHIGSLVVLAVGHVDSGHVLELVSSPNLTSQTDLGFVGFFRGGRGWDLVSDMQHNDSLYRGSFTPPLGGRGGSGNDGAGVGGVLTKFR